MNRKILFLKQGGHHSHYIFLSKLNYIDIPVELKNIIGNPLNLRKTLIIKHFIKYIKNSIIVTEEPRVLDILKFYSFGKIKKYDNIFIFIAATPLIYYALNGIYLNFYRKIFTNNPFLYSLKEMDYFVAVSNLVKKYLISFLGKKYENNIKVIYPSPKDEKIKDNLKIKPDLNSHNILFIGNLIDAYIKKNLNYKGIDIIVKSFKIAKREIKDLKLYIVGKYDKNSLKYKIDKDIYFLGFVPDEKMKEIYEKSSLYLHTARFETFGISIIESMYAGLPAIISKNTGAKDIVEKARKDFVLDLDPNKIAEKIIEYYNLKESERKELSDEFREKAKEINPERSSEEFKEFIESINI